MPPFRVIPAKYRRPSVSSTLRRTKKGRTGTKRRSAGIMRKHSAPVSMGTSMKRGKTGPAGMGYSMKQVSDTCTRITGRAYVGEVNSTSKLVVGDKQNALGLIFDVNPTLLNDRVAVISSTFQKYVYQRVKFTYVPQCSTAVSGSVGLVFDRDPLMISANSNGDQFLSEVMSYEHATLTPAYVEASASYTRDPKELKTWFLGAPDATLTTRETSQGNLLVYLSNAEANRGYGFIVMDYVLDLIAPTLLPSKQGIIDIKKAPSQWADCTLAAPVAAAPNCPTTLIGANAMYGFFSPPNWEDKFTGDVAGCVGEIHCGGVDATNASQRACLSLGGAALTNPQLFDANGTALASGVGKSAVPPGQKIYFCIHGYKRPNVSTLGVVWSFHKTLSSARAAATYFQSGDMVGTNATVLADMLFLGNTTGATVTLGGWARLIAEGSGSEDNA